MCWIHGPQYNLLSCLSFLHSCYSSPGGFYPVQGAPETRMTPHGYGPPQPFLNKLHGHRGQLVLVHIQNYRVVGGEATVYRWPIWPSRQLFRWEWQSLELGKVIWERERWCPDPKSASQRHLQMWGWPWRSLTESKWSSEREQSGEHLSLRAARNQMCQLHLTSQRDELRVSRCQRAPPG